MSHDIFLAYGSRRYTDHVTILAAMLSFMVLDLIIEKRCTELSATPNAKRVKREAKSPPADVMQNRPESLRAPRFSASSYQGRFHWGKNPTSHIFQAHEKLKEHPGTVKIINSMRECMKRSPLYSGLLKLNLDITAQEKEMRARIAIKSLLPWMVTEDEQKVIRDLAFMSPYLDQSWKVAPPDFSKITLPQWYPSNPVQKKLFHTATPTKQQSSALLTAALNQTAADDWLSTDGITPIEKTNIPTNVRSKSPTYGFTTQITETLPRGATKSKDAVKNSKNEIRDDALQNESGCTKPVQSSVSSNVGASQIASWPTVQSVNTVMSASISKRHSYRHVNAIPTTVLSFKASAKELATATPGIKLSKGKEDLLVLGLSDDLTLRHIGKELEKRNPCLVPKSPQTKLEENQVSVDDSHARGTTTDNKSMSGQPTQTHVTPDSVCTSQSKTTSGPIFVPTKSTAASAVRASATLIPSVLDTVGLRAVQVDASDKPTKITTGNTSEHIYVIETEKPAIIPIPSIPIPSAHALQPKPHDAPIPSPTLSSPMPPKNISTRSGEPEFTPIVVHNVPEPTTSPGDRPIAVEVLSDGHPPLQTRICLVCLRLCGNDWELTSHVCKCCLCNKAMDRGDMDGHMWCDHREAISLCEDCGRRFILPQHLVLHKRREHGYAAESTTGFSKQTFPILNKL